MNGKNRPMEAAAGRPAPSPLHGRAENAGYGHWNALGHEVAGTWMAEALCAQLALDPPDRSGVDP